MLQSLSLVTLQAKVECVPKDPEYLAAIRALVELGLVERTILPDEWCASDDDFAVDEGIEWSMLPAVTLMCATTLVPWISGIFDAPSHFEALVAVMMVAICYGQTGNKHSVSQLAKAVPYQAKENHLFFFPATSKNLCLLNGPQAPYCDLMVVKCPENNATASGLSAYLQSLASDFPTDSILIQCKLSGKMPDLALKSEDAKMGFLWDTGDGNRTSPEEPLAGLLSDKETDQYKSGRWLTRKCFWWQQHCLYVCDQQAVSMR